MVAPLLGLIATSVTPPDRARPESALDRIRPYLDDPDGLDVLKVVTGWGLGTAWTEATRRAACRIPRRGIVVRTVHGDLSAYGGRHEYLHPEHVEAEITPWWDARDPDRLFAIELGNEPLLHPEPSDERAHAYAHYLGLTIAMCRDRFPGARLIGPAHTLNEPIRVGAVADGQELWTQICAPQLRQCDALAIHAYTLHQYLRGIKLCRTHVGAHPVWVTEFALDEAMPDDIRGRRYAEVIRQFAVEGVCLYHLDEVGGEDPIHFNPNYALNLPTVRALAQAWRQGDAAPAPAPAPAPASPATVGALPVRDVRPQLDVIRSRVPKPRVGPPTSATLHYNGPAVSAFGSPAAELAHIIKVDVPWQQQSPKVRGDSLQYHFCVLSDGSILQTRDLSLPASHCGDAVGNRSSLAIHLPLGGTQDATAAQWAATLRLFEELIITYRWAGRNAIRLHSEWSETLCPGPNLTRRLLAWRTGAISSGGMYRIRRDVAAANVREGPGRSYPVALGGQARMWPGDAVDADALVSGEAINGDPLWLHRRDGVGFVHRSLVEAV